MYLYILEGQNFLISISTNDLPTVTNVLYLLQGVSQKIETTDVFSESGNIIYQRLPPWLATKHFLVLLVKCWETPSWERNISKHDI